MYGEFYFYEHLLFCFVFSSSSFNFSFSFIEDELFRWNFDYRSLSYVETRRARLINGYERRYGRRRKPDANRPSLKNITKMRKRPIKNTVKRCKRRKTSYRIYCINLISKSKLNYQLKFKIIKKNFRKFVKKVKTLGHFLYSIFFTSSPFNFILNVEVQKKIFVRIESHSVFFFLFVFLFPYQLNE